MRRGKERGERREGEGDSESERESEREREREREILLRHCQIGSSYSK